MATPAVEAQTAPGPQPDLVVTGVSCDSAHSDTLFSFSLSRSGEVTFVGVAGARELGERNEQLPADTAAKVLKLASKLRHRHDPEVPQGEPALCVRVVQARDARPPCGGGDPFIATDPNEVQAFWDLVHQHIPFERRRPRGEVAHCPTLITSGEKIVVPESLGGRRD